MTCTVLWNVYQQFSQWNWHQSVNDAPRNTLGYCVVWRHLASTTGKICRMIWCDVQRKHKLLKTVVIYLVLSASKYFSMQFIDRKSFWTFYFAFCKDILHLLSPNTALKNKIQNGRFLLGTRVMVYVIKCKFMLWQTTHLWNSLGHWICNP